MAEVRVFAHYRALLPASSQEYLNQLQDLAGRVFSSEAWGERAARTAIQAGTAPDVRTVPAALEALSQSQMDAIAEQELTRLVALQAPETEAVECHLFPCLNQERRGGFCFAPGKMLILIPLMDQWQKRLKRNITHEYSHTLRMTRWPVDQRHGFGPAFRYTVREHLVFEGLAENLVEQLHPDPAFPAGHVSVDDEQRFWNAVFPHFDSENWEAYRILMNPAPDLPRGIGYTIGYRIVRSFLRRHGLDALSAHQLPYDALYWNSGYALLR